MAHDFENMEMTDDQFELYQIAKNWYYSKHYGTEEEIVSKLYDLLIKVTKAEKKKNA